MKVNLYKSATKSSSDSHRPGLISCQITGWAPRSALTWQQRPSFYKFEYEESTPERWTTDFDGPAFELFWAQLDNLPAIVPSQAVWLAFLSASVSGKAH